jgi:hypothetical protein
MRFVPHALLFCILTASSLARVADTGGQVQARYGEPIPATASELGALSLRLTKSVSGWFWRWGSLLSISFCLFCNPLKQDGNGSRVHNTRLKVPFEYVPTGMEPSRHLGSSIFCMAHGMLVILVT